MKSILILLILSQQVFSKTNSHQLTLFSTHGSKTLILNEVQHNQTHGYFIAFQDSKLNEAIYERIERIDFQKRTTALTQILRKTKRVPSSTCFEKMRYQHQESGKTQKKLDLCWDQISMKDRIKILHWWKTGL
jgi:hypothetical protein